MSGTNYTNPINGVNYNVLAGTGIVFGNGIPTGSSQVTITNSWDDAGGGIVPTTAIFTAPNTAIGSLAAAGTFYVAPTASASVNVIASVLTTWHIGGTLSYSDTVSLLGTTFDIDGGTLQNGASGIAALSGETINLGDNGTANLGSTLLSVLSGATVNFENGGPTQGGTLLLDGTGGTGGIGILSGTTINNFVNTSDKIGFAGITAPITRYVITNNTVLGSVTSQTIMFYSGTNGLHQQGSFTVQGDNLTAGTTSIAPGSTQTTGSLGVSEVGGAVVFDVSPGATLCFLAGTMILTPDGERAIETLKIGDLVVTLEGKIEPVRWMGINTATKGKGDPLKLLPIRIRADALGENMPARDLLVSSEHALLVDDVLMQAGALVNDLSIVREYDVPETFTYYHVELASHELILAEGVPAETFVDNVDRMAFDNWAEHEALYGDMPIEEMTLPRAQSKRQVKPSTQRWLQARAEVLFATPLEFAA